LIIKPLPSEVKAYISAAQGTPTPNQVIKELIENALDANAKNIEIDITSPFSFKVKDNGIGIPYEDLPNAIKRFYTSKISSLEDVKNIKSLGYRGEALYSISLVSKLTIKSRYEKEEVGGLLKSVEGKITVHKPFPFNKGTLVLVEDLFFNFPARRKGLKESKFLSFVKNLLLAYYLVYDVSFTLKTKKELFNLPFLSFEEKLNFIFQGKSFETIKGKYFSIFYTSEKIKGLENLFIVNKRPMDFKIFENKFLKNIKNFYKNIIVILDIPPAYIDIHISPYKDKFEFTSKAIEDLIKEELKDIFGKKVYPFYSKERFLLKEEQENIFDLKLLGYLDEDIIVGYTKEYVYYFDFHLIFEIYNSVFLNLDEKTACKYALVKKGKMSLEEIKEIILEVLSSGQITCPHGRPLFVKFPKKDILKKLGR